MKLTKIFQLGHHVARDPKGRRVVAVKGMKLWRDGFYELNADSLSALAQLGRVGPNDLSKQLPADDQERDSWSPELECCWCEACGRTRRTTGTLTD